MKSVKILILEDAPEDVRLAERALKKEFDVLQLKAVNNKADFIQSIKTFNPNVILVDYDIPGFSGKKALEICVRDHPEIPIIFVTGTMGEELAVEFLKSGAWDFVLKTNLPRLPSAVTRSLREVEESRKAELARREQAESERRLRALLENAPICIKEVDLNGKIISMNRSGIEMIRKFYDGRIIGTKFLSMVHKRDIKNLGEALKVVLSGGEAKVQFSSKGNEIVFESFMVPLKNENGEIVRIIGLTSDVTDRIKSEEEIRRKNALMESLINAIPDVVYFKDRDMRYVSINKAFKHEIGKDEAQIIGKKDEDVLPEGFLIKTRKDDLEVFEKRGLVINDQEMEMQDGSLKIFDSRKMPIFDKDNKNVVGVVGISRDITHQRISEEKLKKSEALLQEAERVANVGSWEFYPNRGGLNWSQETYRIFGISVKEGVPSYKNLLTYFQDEDRLFFNRCIRQALSEGESFTIDHRIICHDQSIKWVRSNGRPYLNGNGEVEKIVGTVQDITDQKRDEQKLIKSRMLLKEAQTMARLGSFEWEVEGDYLRCSDEFLSVLEIPEDDLLINLDSYLRKIHKSDRSIVKQKIFEAQEECSSYDVEHRIPVSGGLKIVKSQGSFRANDKGEAAKLFGFVQDITERKYAENALIQGQEMERKRIAREIHDGIGQMLVATKFHISALEGASPQEVEKRIDDILSMLGKTIEETRRISKNLSTRVLEELGLEKAIRQLCQEAAKIKNMDFDLKVNVNGEGSTSATEASYRIIQEAINNIVKHTSASKVAIRLELVDSYLKLKVDDNGEGFEMNLTNGYDGHGLRNMRERAKSLNGYLTIESSSGQGTVITARIPVD